MKKLILLALLFAGHAGVAQVTKAIGEFTTIKVFDMINVTLVKSSENKIVLNGERAGEVELVQKGDELKIRMKLTKLLQGEDINATVYYTGRIDQVEASEGAYVSSSDTFTATAFTLNAKEGATISLKVDVDKLNSKLNSGGILHITGSAGNSDIKITSGAVFKGKDLITEQTDVTLSAGGEAYVHASKLVEAKTRAGGEVYVYGNPQQVNKDKFIGGDINIMK